MLTKITHLDRLGGHRLRVRFSDGTGGEYDFSTLAHETGPMVEPLRDEVYFARVFLELGALTWPNGFDVSPEWLRLEMEKAGELSRAAAE